MMTCVQCAFNSIQEGSLFHSRTLNWNCIYGGVFFTLFLPSSSYFAVHATQFTNNLHIFLAEWQKEAKNRMNENVRFEVNEIGKKIPIYTYAMLSEIKMTPTPHDKIHSSQ